MISILGILAAMILPNLRDPPRRAQEAVLKSNLRLLREAIHEYYATEDHLPASLYDLVDAGYLGSLPYDPITKSKDTWVPVLADKGDLALAPVPPESAGKQVVDVRSGAESLSLGGVSSRHGG